MNSSIRKYLVCIFTFSWILWGTSIVLTQLNIAKFATPFVMIFFVFGGIMPAIIEIVLKKKYSSEHEFKTFIKSIINPKHHFLLYVFIVVLAFLSCFLPTLFGGATMQNPLYIALLAFPVMIIGGGLEEIGWRGFLQPALQKQFPDFFSTLIVSAIWTCWHIPLFFIVGSSQYHTDFLYFAVMAIGVSFLLATIYNATQSIFLCIVLHALINSFWAVYIPNGKVYPVCLTLIFGITVFVVFELFKRKSLFSLHKA